MTKPLFLTGIILTVIGAAVFGRFVLPHIVLGSFGPPATGLTEQVSSTPDPLLAFGVLVSGLALAGGFALIGIGLGRWNHPTPSATDGSPEV